MRDSSIGSSNGPSIQNKMQLAPAVAKKNIRGGKRNEEYGGPGGVMMRSGDTGGGEYIEEEELKYSPRTTKVIAGNSGKSAKSGGGSGNPSMMYMARQRNGQPAPAG